MATRSYVIPIGAVLIVLISGVALGAWLREPAVAPIQPIDFNHLLHLERAQGITCADCHQFVTSQTYAGFPSKFICFDCHDPDVDESDVEADANMPRFATLMRFADTEHDIPWQRVSLSRADVFFSHRMHVTVAGLDCKECHPTIAEATSPPTSTPTMFDMDKCIDCHEKNAASADCVSCHR